MKLESTWKRLLLQIQKALAYRFFIIAFEDKFK